MKKIIIIRYCEIHLKGKNRGFFEKIFVNNIERALKNFDCKLIKTSGRYLIDNFDEDDLDSILTALKKVFGIHSLSVGLKTESNLDAIFDACLKVCPKNGTFKVETHRADKTFELNSIEVNREIGARLLNKFSGLVVDVHTPENTVNIDIRENKSTYVFSEFILGAGGMPTGTAGRGLLLISGGIDSPVAGYMMAKRGMKLSVLHFHSYPYTNLQAKEKVVDLAKILSGYASGINMYVVSVTHIQEAIHKNCRADMMVTLLRRFMMRIAEIMCKKSSAQAIITGESLGQVASQTVEGMTSSNAVVKNYPVLRPLVGFDKLEIIERAKKIGTYDTSILPYEDCCTVFLPEHPVIKPKLDEVEAEEAKLDIKALMDEALYSIELIKL